MEAGRDRKEGGGVRNHLILLIRLQTLDRDRDSNQRLVERTAGMIAAREARLVQSREELAVAREALKRAKASAHEAEVNLRARSDEVRKLELQLNTARTNQEFHALQSHIGRLRELSSQEEERTLVLYERIESEQARLAAAEQKLAGMEADVARFRAECISDRERAATELSSTDERREKLLAELPRDLRATYERVRAVREGVAVAACEDRCCAGCGVTIKPNDLARLIAQSQIVPCESCQRILYLPQSLSAEPAS